MAVINSISVGASRPTSPMAEVIARMSVYRDPDAKAGDYRTRATFERGQLLELRLPDGALSVAVADLLP